jgi:23S rRNA pseudouridine1911/1915/1917 synthase
MRRSAHSHSSLMKAFEERRIDKEYLAIVRGAPERDAGVIDMPLGPARTSEVRLKMAPRADGMEARTEWRVVERRNGCALLLCKPYTGRQHQIRVHLDAIGLPLVGDKLYGVDEDTFLRNALGELPRDELRSLGLPRHALHNHALAFVHPVSGARVRIESPLPPDLRAYLDARG